MLPNGITPVLVSASFGVAALADAFTSVPAWLESADKMLYTAKAGGRNCVKWAELS